MISVFKNRHSKFRSLEFQAARANKSVSEGFREDNTSLGDQLPLKCSSFSEEASAIDAIDGRQNGGMATSDADSLFGPVTLLGKLPSAEERILESELELLTMSGKWVSRKLILTEDYIFIMRIEDGDLKDRIPTLEIVTVRKLADAESIRRNSGIFSFENILMADKVCCLEIIPVNGGYNSGRRFFLRHKDEAVCDNWLTAVLAASDRAQRKDRRRSPYYLIEVRHPACVINLHQRMVCISFGVLLPIGSSRRRRASDKPSTRPLTAPASSARDTQRRRAGAAPASAGCDGGAGVPGGGGGAHLRQLRREHHAVRDAGPRSSLIIQDEIQLPVACGMRVRVMQYEISAPDPGRDLDAHVI